MGPGLISWSDVYQFFFWYPCIIEKSRVPLAFVMTQITLVTLKYTVTIHKKKCSYTIQVFDGSESRHEVKTTRLEELKMARFLRIKPTEWNDAIALRTEIYGCMRGEQ